MVYNCCKVVLGILLGLLLTVTPTQALASDPEVEIKVSAWIVGAPSNLILTYISDNEVRIEWIKGVGAVNTMVRVKFGSPPQDRNDGYLVYYGENSTCFDRTIDLTMAQIPIYRAWSQREDGNWENIGTTGEANFMSQSFLFIGLIVLALGVTAASFWRRSIVLSMGAALSWTALGLLLLNSSTILGPYTLGDDWVQVLSLLLFSMAAGCLLYYISGIGKTKITMADSKGRSWEMWGKLPKEVVSSRSQAVRERHKERLRAVRERRRLR